jgi:hypothetical protein
VAIGAEECNAIAGLHSVLPEGTRETSDSFAELLVREAILIANDGRAARILLLGVTKETQGCEWNFHDGLA